jgi:anti-sigma-K factor RskA
MIDERQEELASLYALGLLEGNELASFEASLARDPALQTLVRELRAASTALAHGASSAAPPAALKTRILESVATAPVTATPTATIIRPVFRSWQLIPWAVAACLAIGGAWLAQGYFATQSEVAMLRDQNALVDIARQSAQQQLEAERIITRRQLQDAEQALAGANVQLADVRNQLTERDRLAAEARNQLADRERLLRERERQLAEARGQVAEREKQLATLTQRIDALARESAAVGRELGDARQRITKLTEEMKTQGDLASLKITTLASMLKNSPQALAVAVWDPGRQEGVLNVQNLPALATNQDYQLWLVDPQYPNPVDGGVFSVEPASGTARLQFKAKQPVGTVNAFAVTRERKGGVAKAQGPFVLLGK